jgi:hypothetical protein
MKKIIFIAPILLMFAVLVNAQTPKKIASDTATSVSATAVTVDIDIRENLLGKTISIQGQCDNIGGTTEGTILLKGSLNDGDSWVDINSTTYPNAGFTPNDTVTVTDGQGFHFVIPIDFTDIRVNFTGGASDTTGLGVDYVIY